MRNLVWIIIVLMTFPVLVWSQEVSNVRFEQVGSQIYIYYDLQGVGNYMITAYCSQDGGKTWGNSLVNVSGDVGEDQKTGTNKLIIWDALKERENLLGEVSFKIQTFKDIDINIELVFVKGGSFQMGKTIGGYENKLGHYVEVSDFYIGKYEVTQQQWRSVMGNSPSNLPGCDKCPVERVSWDEVQEFIKNLNMRSSKKYRLPTEAEWEYVAKGGYQSVGYRYSGSDDIDEVAWYGNNSDIRTHGVGRKKPNKLGVFDMTGNVWEWCSDWYGKYENLPAKDPQGPLNGSKHVIRGGSWYNEPSRCLTTVRNKGGSDYRDIDLGFRLVSSY